MGLVGIGLSCLGSAASASSWPRRTRFDGFDERHLAIRQAGGGEAMHVAFRTRSGVVDMIGVNRLSFLFRDWRDEGQGLLIEVALFDVLARMQTVLTTLADRPTALLLNSGYRTPERNRTIEGAAVHSQHIVGRAADIQAGGFDDATVADVAEVAGGHGVGRYENFTHVDVGPRGRRWSG